MLELADADCLHGDEHNAHAAVTRPRNPRGVTDAAQDRGAAPRCPAALAVICPKCKVGFGRLCKSTGGGNYAAVPTHKARRDRIAGWSDKLRRQYSDLVRQYRHEPWKAPTDQVAEAEAAAKPIPVKAGKQPTPKGVRLSEPQAKEIERAAANDGKTAAPTGHFHGDAAHRQTVLSLHAKGILAEGELFDEDYHRRYTLTAFGWDVYRQHRLIIRNNAADRWAALNDERSPA